MPSRVWMPADALALRCDIEEVGTLRTVAVEVLDRAPPALPRPEELRARALLALVRIAEEGEGRAAVTAAVEVLNRTEPEAGAAPRPSWAGLDESRRYRPDAPAIPSSLDS